MTERFYAINHLLTEQLRELFLTYRTRGWVDSEYYQQNPAESRPPELSEADILLNIDAEDEHNYCVFMLDHEDEEDGIMICFGMSYCDFAIYLHLPPQLLDEMVEKYALHVFDEKKDSTWEEHLVEEMLKNSLN
jgi:hypothetical protein